MSQYKISKPNHHLLKPYIENYMYVSGERIIPSKKIPPRPGGSLIMDFTTPYYCNDNRFSISLNGIQKESFIYRAGSAQDDHLVIRFHPYGLERFIDMPVNELTDHIVDPEIVFGSEIKRLYRQVAGLASIDQRIKKVEQFLVARLSFPSTEDKSIFRIANLLRDSLGNIDFDTLREQAPWSARQLERKFKAIVGVDMQTYIRICRFDYAKSLVLHHPSLTLTDIGFNAGYYDQPHFSNEVKRMTGVSPKQLEECMTT